MCNFRIVLCYLWMSIKHVHLLYCRAIQQKDQLVNRQHTTLKNERKIEIRFTGKTAQFQRDCQTLTVQVP